MAEPATNQLDLEFAGDGTQPRLVCHRCHTAIRHGSITRGLLHRYHLTCFYKHVRGGGIEYASFSLHTEAHDLVCCHCDGIVHGSDAYVWRRRGYEYAVAAHGACMVNVRDRTSEVEHLCYLGSEQR